MALVVRDDALEAVTDLVKARGLATPTRLAITSLSPSEVAALLTAIPELARVARDSRTHWLLARIGLVELLLKTADRGSCLPDTLSSEAEIFATVWKGLIRQDERVVGDVAPDDREAALMDVARQLMTGASSTTAQTGRALASLRSDGVLVSRRRSTVWQAGDRFGSDVLRDFAAARLLLRDGLEGAPLVHGPSLGSASGSPSGTSAPCQKPRIWCDRGARVGRYSGRLCCTCCEGWRPLERASMGGAFDGRLGVAGLE